MATQTVWVCDFGGGTCENPATRYRLWREGDKQSWEVDLCDQHAKPVLAALSLGRVTDLPARQRQRMEVTKLRQTPRTRHLKKPKE